MRGAEFAELAAFAAVAEQRSFAKAAKRLGVATSTLSHNLRALETRLGVRLLNRTTRSVAATEAGERLLAQLRPALEGLDGAVAAVGAFRTAPAGRLRLTVPPPAAEIIIAPLLARFAGKYPEIELEVSVDGAMSDIVKERFDAGIRMGRLVERDMIGVRIGPPLKVAVVAAPEYVARRGRPRNPADLVAHQCIRMRLPNGEFLPWRFERHGKPVAAEPPASIVFNDRDLELRAALDGIGIAYVVRGRVDSSIAAGALIPLLGAWLPPATNFLLYYPSGRLVPPPLRAFIDFIRREFDDSRPANGTPPRTRKR